MSKRDRLFLHPGSITKESYYYYEYLTIAITCNNGSKYILDGIILRRGSFVEDYIHRMIQFFKQYLAIEVVLFDRGFGWGVVYKLKQLDVDYLIFWKKQGEWYLEYFDEMKDGEMVKIQKSEKYNRKHTNYPVDSDFVLIKQHEYKGKRYDWIFATSLDLETAKAYIVRYKKRWGIETIYRVTDDIRLYTTSTNPVIRYFLFMFTCFVYNIWKFFQRFLGEEFTLGNFKTNMIIFFAKIGNIYPKHYDSFENIAKFWE